MIFQILTGFGIVILGFLLLYALIKLDMLTDIKSLVLDYLPIGTYLEVVWFSIIMGLIVFMSLYSESRALTLLLLILFLLHLRRNVDEERRTIEGKKGPAKSG